MGASGGGGFSAFASSGRDVDEPVILATSLHPEMALRTLWTVRSSSAGLGMDEPPIYALQTVHRTGGLSLSLASD